MSLKNKTIKGIKWTALSGTVISTAQFIQLSVLARFLLPETFGSMATLMVIVGFSQLYMDMGVSRAIIHHQNITHRELSSLYWLNVISGFVLFIILLILSPFIVNFLGETDLQMPLLICSTTFIIIAFGNPYRILCQKQMLFNVSAKIEILATIFALVTTVSLAIYGAEIYALVIGMIVSTSTSTILFLLFGLKNQHRPNLHFHYKEIRHFIKFGIYQLGDQSTNYFSTNIDKLLISKVLGMDATGYYDMAWRLIIFPTKVINPIISNVTFPVYAKIQNDSYTLNQYYYYTIKSLSLITVPILSFLCVYSKEVVNLVFGSGWDVVAELIVPLSIVGIVRALGNPGGYILLALGHANVCFWWNLTWALIVTLSIVTGLFIKPSVDIISIILLSLSLTVGTIWHYLISKYGGIKYKKVIIEYAKVTSICFLIGLISRELITDLTIRNMGVRLLVAGTSCMTMYCVYLYGFERKTILRTFKIN